MTLSADYWTERYQLRKTGWNIGYPSPPIIKYMHQISDKTIRILIPGCGNAYEAEHLFNAGFSNVHLLDFAPEPLADFKKRVPGFPNNQLICEDFFEHNTTFDLIIEQTFFCSLPPKRRTDYVSQAKKLLAPKGKLVGLLFDTVFEKEGPPFGGSKKEYDKLFGTHFRIKTLDKCYNSIPQRLGNELFFIFEHL